MKLNIILTVFTYTTCTALQSNTNYEKVQEYSVEPKAQIVEIIELMFPKRNTDYITKPDENINKEIKLYPKQLTFINEPPEQEIRILYEEEDMLVSETRNVVQNSRRDDDALPLSIESNGSNIQKQKLVKTTEVSTHKREVEEKSKHSTKARSSTSSSRPIITPDEVYQPILEPKPKQQHYGLGETVVLSLANEKQTMSSMAKPLYVDQTKPYEDISLRPTRYDEYVEERPVVSNGGRETYREPKPVYQNRPVGGNSGGRDPEPVYQNRPVGGNSGGRDPETVYQSRPVGGNSGGRDPEPVYQSRPPAGGGSGRRDPYREPDPVYQDNEEDYSGIFSNQNDPYKQKPSIVRKPTYEEQRPAARPTYRPEPSRFEEERNQGYQGFPESHSSNQQFATPLQNNVRTYPASPCLNVFTYEGREPEVDKWYGTILVTTDTPLVGMRLDITLDKPAEMLSNWISEVRTKDNVHFTILSLKKTLVPGPAEAVRILVRFNRNKPIPFVESISLNGRRICPYHKPNPNTLASNRPTNPKRTTTEYYLEESSRRPQPTNYYEENIRPVRPESRPDYTDATYNRPDEEYYNPNPNPNNNNRRTTTEAYYSSERTTQRTTEIYRPQSNPNSNDYQDTRPKPKPTETRPTQTQTPNTRPSSSNNRPSSNTPTSKPTTRPSNNKETAKPNSLSQKPSECGKASVQPRPLVTNGQMTARGQWPWHVALYKNEGINLNYICGGSLISENLVVTAAHCVTHRLSTKPVEASVLVVYLGKYHLKLWSEGGVKDKQVSEVHVHPSYNNTSFSSDIAVVALSSPVEFSNYIKPVCLWDRRKLDISNVVGKEGTVVGWGYDENQRLTEELMQAVMPVVTQETCLRSFPSFFPHFTSNLTYCAGFRNGTSVCNGDSGGGMVFPISSNNEVRWFLRGLVSISVSEKDLKVCDTKHYVVFTDVAKYLDWIDNFF